MCTRQKFTVALIYPSLVTLVALGVIAVLLVYVVPQVVAVYEHSRQTLPWLTHTLIATSQFFRETAALWLALAVSIPVGCALALRSRALRARWHALLLRVPGLGRLAGSLDTARFASTLAILVGSGTPLLRALVTAAGVMRLAPLADAARAAAARVREGTPLAAALKAQSLFPGYSKKRYQPKLHRVKIVYFSAPNVGGLFWVVVLLRELFWLLSHSNPHDIILLPPDGLLLAPVLKVAGRKNIHLDVRTVPVEVNSARPALTRLLYGKLTMRGLSKLATGYSFITERLRLQAEGELRITFKDYVTWQSGVNTQKISIQPAFLSAESSSDFILFYHGTLSRNRGIDSVIQALTCVDSRYRNHISFVIVGAGPALPELKRHAARTGLAHRVIFKGLIPYESIPAEIATADCCICPLPNRTEWNVSSPLKVFEYMASGKPMILTPIPAHLDVAQGYDFVVWTRGYDAEALGRAIQSAYLNRAFLRRAATTARVVAEQTPRKSPPLKDRRLH